jgi:hypothetical protein
MSMGQLKGRCELVSKRIQLEHEAHHTDDSQYGAIHAHGDFSGILLLCDTSVHGHFTLPSAFASLKLLKVCLARK